ncbi:MAG: T9SS type A sorting domain-containing protein [Candidatus Marinimicrobia bacterium]|nr:T9SS type A sorting domain-containing protein [Candidatus Neomarinimicrobiota bacterium]
MLWLPIALDAQVRLPIHMQELADNRGVAVDFQRIDSLAALEPAPMPRALQPTKEIIGYLPYWQYGSYSSLNYDLLTQINYFSAELGPDGSITNDHGWTTIDLVTYAHARGVKVKLTATLFGGTDLETLLGSPTNRQRAIDNLLSKVQSMDADGVDIDFELMPADQQGNMIIFMQALTAAFRDNIPGAIITMAMPAVDWGNPPRWDYLALANIVDALFIMGYDYHWDGSQKAGPVSPLDGFSRNVRWTVDDYLAKTGSNTAKIVLGLPYYGRDWPVISFVKYATTIGKGRSTLYSAAVVDAQTHGRQWDATSSSPWFNYADNDNRQVWYDDSLSLALKYELALDKDLAGVGMWALGYDGTRQELWGALADHFGVAVPPGKPVNMAARNNGDGTVTFIIPGLSADTLLIYTGASPNSITLFGSYTGSEFTVSGLPTDAVVYFQVQGENTGGAGPISEVLAVSTRRQFSQVLIINGFDRTTTPNNTFDYIKRYAPEIDRLDLAFDAATNEAVSGGAISLDDYEAAIWILGEEATADASLDGTEQALVADYLQSGGKLLISGSEIGYDLADPGTAADRVFYGDYLKAEYITDRTLDNFGDISYIIEPENGSLIAGLAPFSYDDGSHGAYNVDWPDGIKPVGDAKLVARYKNVDYTAMGGAGISYAGKFGTSTIDGSLIYLAVGFEAIYPATARDSLMARFMSFFQVQADTTAPPDEVLATRLLPNYPNPWRTQTTIPFIVGSESQVQISIYNLRGMLVSQLVSETLQPHEYAPLLMPFNRFGRPLASGVYLISLDVDGQRVDSRKMTLIK